MMGHTHCDLPITSNWVLNNSENGMRHSLFLTLIFVIGYPVDAAESSIEEMIGDMEMRDVLLEELGECLKVMTTSLYVKTYEEKSSDLFPTDEDTISEAKELAFVGDPSSLNGMFVWQSMNYGTLSYSREEFPTDFSDEVTLLTRE